MQHAVTWYNTLRNVSWQFWSHTQLHSCPQTGRQTSAHYQRHTIHKDTAQTCVLTDIYTMVCVCASVHVWAHVCVCVLVSICVSVSACWVWLQFSRVWQTANDILCVIPPNHVISPHPWQELWVPLQELFFHTGTLAEEVRFWSQKPCASEICVMKWQWCKRPPLRHDPKESASLEYPGMLWKHLFFENILCDFMHFAVQMSSCKHFTVHLLFMHFAVHC